MRISSRTAQTEIPQYWLEWKRICLIKSLKLLNLILLFQILYEDKKNIEIRKLFFAVVMPKSQVGSLVFILILTGLLNILFTSFFLLFIFFLYNVTLLLSSLLLVLIRILLLRPYEQLNKTSDSYQNHDDSKKPLMSKNSLSKNCWIITYSINDRMKKKIKRNVCALIKIKTSSGSLKESKYFDLF